MIVLDFDPEGVFDNVLHVHPSTAAPGPGPFVPRIPAVFVLHRDRAVLQASGEGVGGWGDSI